ncbi:TPA: tetratricopeptide repeat protein, partial [Candidatus Poribacteria bacterium]|nr:tetratricopeptide repeat protein [Candidatus Poribacteria bacterium]
MLQLRFYLLTFSLILFYQPYTFSQGDRVALSLRKAEGEFQNGNWAEALKIYQRLAADRPDSVPAQVGMASSLVKLKDYPPAIVAFHRALKFSPNLSRVQGALADTYDKNRQPDEAIKWYQKAIKS